MGEGVVSVESFSPGWVRESDIIIDDWCGSVMMPLRWRKHQNEVALKNHLVYTVYCVYMYKVIKN